MSRADVGSQDFDGLEEYTTEYPVPNNLQVEEVTIFQHQTKALSLTLTSAAFIVAGGSSQSSTGEVRIELRLVRHS
ncbi:MAG: hypothetical protein R3B54_10660 [Bdellovibrionota bacterium]